MSGESVPKHVQEKLDQFLKDAEQDKLPEGAGAHEASSEQEIKDIKDIQGTSGLQDPKLETRS